MAQAGQLQFGVDETYLSNSVSRALIKGVNEAKRSGGALTPNINEQAWRMPLGRITGDVDKFKSSLNAANQRVIAFSASASVFYGISTALKGLVTSTISVNKNMTDLNAIFKLSAADLTKFKNELFDVARSTGQAIDTVSKSSIEFSRQGLGVAETLKRTRDALILTRLTGLDAAEAANTLTAAVNSFNKSGLNTTEILNKMVAADSAFAVSSKDIADALVRVGSSAQDAGVQFNELIALVTTTKQVTGRDGAVIGNALKTLLARQDRGTVIETLEKLGVSVRDASSNVLPYITVLKNLAKQYDTLGISQKQQVSQLLGGVYQSNILKALMGDLAKSNSVYEQSLNAVGKAQDEAIKRNEYLNSSLATTIENLKTSFTQISSNLGENVLNKNIKSIGSGINTIFGKEFSDSFANGLKGVDSEGAGNFIGQGLIKGISNVFGVSGGIPGAGLLAIGATLFKVLSSTLGTALKDMQNLLAFNEKSLAIQQGIDKAILGANSAEQTRLLTAKTLADQEQVILDILLRQKAAMQTMAAEKNALRVDVISNNPRLAKEAYRAGKGIPTGASGILPAIAQESHAISKGIGGASSSAKPVVIPNFNFGGGKTGPIVANTDEYLVKNYAGGGSAIFNKQMIGQMGLPRGAVKIASDGHIPNFANLFYRGVGRFPKSTFNDPFSLSDSKAALFASRDLEEAKSYGFNIGQFSLKRGLKGLNLYSPKGIEILNSVLKKEFGFSDEKLNLGTFGNPESKALWKKVRKNTIYPALDNNYVNDALRKAGYDFISFPDKGNIDQYGSYETKKNISILNQSALINKSLLSAASGWTPLNIENQYGRLLGNQIGNKFQINDIYTSKQGLGYSNYLYKELFQLLGERGVKSVFGQLVPQGVSNDFTNLKAQFPQLGRGKFGSSSLLRLFDSYENIGPSISFGGGAQFDKDLGISSRRIAQLIRGGYNSLPEFTTYLAGGHIPNFADVMGWNFADPNSVIQKTAKPTIGLSKGGLKGILAELANLNVVLGRTNKPSAASPGMSGRGDYGAIRINPQDIKKIAGEYTGSYLLAHEAGHILQSYHSWGARSLKTDLKEGNANFFTLDVLKKYGTKQDVENYLNFAKEQIKSYQSYDEVVDPVFPFRGETIQGPQKSLEQLMKKRDPRSGRAFSFRYGGDNPFFASGHIPNFARRGRPSIKGPQVRYEGPMDFSSILGPEGLLELFTIFGFGLGNHPSKSTIDAKTLQKFGINIPSGLTPGSKFPYRNYAAGGIPNSVAKAIDRELKAGAPLSSIYVDSDPRLISPKNPRGILVANRRDEPAGGFEGVNKYRELGLDPKAAGATHVPNFADPSELILKYLLKGNQPTSILGNIAYPGSTASVADAQKSVEKELAKIVKGINIKDVDFLSGPQSVSKTLQDKIKKSVQQAFSGVDFGKTSAFSKLSDEVLLGRKKEINGLIQLQTAQKKAEVSAQKRLEYEKRVGLSNIGEKIINTSSRVLSPETLAAAQAKSQANYAAFAGSAMATKTPQELYLSELKMAMKESNASLKRMVAANEIDRKLSSGVKYGQLTGLEQIALQKQFQKQAFQNLGFGATGLSLEQTLRNKDARQQIAQYVNTQIAQISENPRFAPPPSRLAKWSNRINSAALPLAFGAPMLAGFIPEGQGGTTAGKASGAASGALQGLGTGAAIGMSFGPYGAAIGALAGTMVGAISGAASKWNKSFEEIGRDIETANAKNQQVISNIQLYVQQADQVTELIKSGVDSKRIRELIEKQSKLYSSFEDPTIRAAVSSDPSEALRLATERAIEERLSGDVLSASKRNTKEIGTVQRFYSKLKIGALYTAAQLGGSLSGGSITPNLYSKVEEKVSPIGSIGKINQRGVSEIANVLLEASDKMNKIDFQKFEKISKSSPAFALKEYSDLFGMSIESMNEFLKDLDINEIKAFVYKFNELKSIRLTRAGEIEPFIGEQNKRFQISNADWQRTAFEASLKINKNSIFGGAAIENKSALSNALLDINPDINDISRVSQSGNIQLNALRESNRLNLINEAQRAVTSIAGMSSKEKNKFRTEDLRASMKMFMRVGETGDTGELQQTIKELTAANRELIDSNNESVDATDKQIISSNQQLEISRPYVLKMQELIDTMKANEDKLDIANKLNVIKATEQQKQTFLNQAVFNPESFETARQLNQRASGNVYTRTRYKTGLTLQSQLEKQDFLSGLGIAQTDESLAAISVTKKARSRETMAQLLRSELGTNVGSDEKSLNEAIAKLRTTNPITAGRYAETLKPFDAKQAILDLQDKTQTPEAVLNEMMKRGTTDPTQNLIAQNTGSIATSTDTINTDMNSGFNALFGLMDKAFNNQAAYEKFTDAFRQRGTSELNLLNRKDDVKVATQRILESEAGRKLIGSINVNTQSGVDVGSYYKRFARGEISAKELYSELEKPENQIIAKDSGYPDFKETQLGILQNLASSIDDGSLKKAIQEQAAASEKLKVATENLTKIQNAPIAQPTGAITPVVSVKTSASNIATSPKKESPGLGSEAKTANKGSDTFRGFRTGLEQATNDIKDFETLGVNAGKAVAQSFGDAFAGLVTGSIQGTNAWKSFVSSVLAGLAQMYAQEAMKGLISSLIGSGTSGGSSAASTGVGIAFKSNMGGSILKFASGGNVPALLTGGEFYYTPSQARSIGQNNLHAINSGTAKFARGGLVSGGSGYMDDVPAMLDNGGFVIKRSAVQKYGASKLSDIGGGVAMFASGGNVAPVSTSGGGSGNGNTSVKIDIHDNRTSASADSDQSTNDPEFNKRLSLAVKTKVLQVIQEQRRIGGVLRQGKNY